MNNSRNPWNNNRNGRNIGRPNNRPRFSGQFLGINPNAKFLNDDQKVEGIQLVTSFRQVRQLQERLGECAGGPTDFFPAMWSVNLLPENISILETEPHFVIPKPCGTRYLLYVDPSGQIFLENNAQNIFRIDDNHAIKFISSDGQPITDTILDGKITRVADNRPDAGRLTFVITDATLCRGVSLRTKNISQRIAFVRDEIMKPRLNNPTTISDKEAFNLDIVECKESYEAEDFMTEQFRDEIFKYWIANIMFVPRDKEYTCGTCFDVYRWRENNDGVCYGVFRLKIPEGTSTDLADLHVVGPNRMEINFASITLTDELRQLNGRIIGCTYVDNQWVFARGRHDREHPNGRIAIESKLKESENPVTRSRLLTSLEIAGRRH